MTTPPPQPSDRLSVRVGVGLSSVAGGVEETRALLDRFIARGATKFVLNPIANDPAGWLRELFPRVVAPLEQAGVSR